jgi:hypothetical protein
MAFKIPWDESKYYSVSEVAKFLGFGEDWVRARFKKLDPPLVLKSRSEKPKRRVRRDFTTLRIVGAAITMVAMTMQ